MWGSRPRSLHARSYGSVGWVWGRATYESPGVLSEVEYLAFVKIYPSWVMEL
jgi:hypothetical protein